MPVYTMRDISMRAKLVAKTFFLLTIFFGIVPTTPGDAQTSKGSALADEQQVKQFLSSLMSSDAAGKIKVVVRDAKYSPSTHELVIALSVTNAGVEAVRFGELVADGFRFLDPALFKLPVPYPEKFVVQSASLDNEVPIYPSGTRETTLKIGEFDRLLQSKRNARSRRGSSIRINGYLAFFSSTGRRYAVRIDKAVETPASETAETAQEQKLKRQFLDALDPVHAAPAIQAIVKDAAYDATAKTLTLEFQARNVGDEMVKFGELIVDERRFLNPRIYTAPVRNYPLQLVYTSAASIDSDNALTSGETREVKLVVSDFDSVMNARKDKMPAALDAFLEFWSPVGHRFVTRINAKFRATN